MRGPVGRAIELVAGRASAEPKRAPLSDAWLAAGGALLLRLAVVAWAAPRFPPAEDGRFYDTVARRIAEGHGYTWLWPDGVVTYAAHYPVGYPAAVGGIYAVFGASPLGAMLFNAVVGAALVLAVHRLAAVQGSRRSAAVVAAVAAAHPTLLMYTPALMTDGVAAAVVAIACWVALPRQDSARWGLILGLVLGLGTLVRPQLVLLAPALGYLGARWRCFSRSRSLVRSLLIGAASLVVVAPWTLRNCEHMGRCAFVSANGGWNLLIGTAAEARGGWASLDALGVPEGCKLVFEEAAKDACFQAAAVERIEAEPLAWLALVPEKLARTFDDVGAPGWYLGVSNPESFGGRAAWWVGAVEVLFQRGSLLALLAWLALQPGRGRAWRRWAALTGIALLGPAAWLALLVAALACLTLPGRQWPLATLVALVVLTTMVTHGVFFGAARYAMVTFPVILGALAGPWGRLQRPFLTASRGPRDTARC